jgi:RNA polymerase sigma-70 factor, ECF subfamily
MAQAKVALVPQSHAQHDFAALFAEYGPSVLALLRRLAGNPHDADDLFQETAVRVWRRLNDRPQLRNSRAWLMSIAYHVFLDQCGARRLATADASRLPGTEQSPAERLELAEETDRAISAIAGLPSAVREVVLLHYTGGLTLRETAQAMGISSGTVRSRLNTALKELRRKLQ